MNHVDGDRHVAQSTELRVRAFCRAAFAPAVLVVLIASVIDTGASRLPEGSDKLEHALAFLALGLLGYPRWPALRLCLALALYGLSIECIQWFLPWREFSLLDWTADAVGVVVAALGARSRRKAGRHEFAR